MLVKVCGITTEDQYNALAELGVAMIGINFYPKSKRYVERCITTKKLDSQTNNVGVFVNPSLEEVFAAAKNHKLNIIQLHGNESVALCKSIAASYPVIKAFGVDDSFDFDSVSKYEGICESFLFDTKTSAFGGSGTKFNWIKLNEYTGKTSFLLSGGITINDSADILNIEHPKFIGIDINSGFEIMPGIKNIELIEELKNLLE